MAGQKRAIRPYLIGKLGAAVFTKKVLSTSASYANFNVSRPTSAF